MAENPPAPEPPLPPAGLPAECPPQPPPRSAALAVRHRARCRRGRRRRTTRDSLAARALLRRHAATAPHRFPPRARTLRGRRDEDRVRASRCRLARDTGRLGPRVALHVTAGRG